MAKKILDSSRKKIFVPTSDPNPKRRKPTLTLARSRKEIRTTLRTIQIRAYLHLDNQVECTKETNKDTTGSFHRYPYRINPSIIYFRKKNTMKFTTCCAVLVAITTVHWLPANAWTSPMQLKGIKSMSSQTPAVGRYGSRLGAVGDIGEKESSSSSQRKSTETKRSSGPVGHVSRDWTQPIAYEQLTIGVVKESLDGENRVSQTPDSVRGLVKAGFTVLVEAGGTVAVKTASFDSFFMCLTVVFLFQRSWRASLVQ